MRTWIGGMLAVLACCTWMDVPAQDAPQGDPQATVTPYGPVRIALAGLAHDSTAADSLRSFTQALEACGRATHEGLVPDSSCTVVRKGLAFWSAEADSLPDDLAWPFFHALGDLHLADANYAKALDAFATAQRRSAAGDGADQRLMEDLTGRTSAFVQLHRYDSAYAVMAQLQAVRDRVRDQAHAQETDSLRGMFRTEAADIEDSLNTVRKQALQDQRHAERRAEWMLYALIGAGALALLFLVLFVVKKKKPARIVTVQAPSAGANAAPKPAPPPTPEKAPAPPPPAPPSAPGNRISAGIFSAEEFTADLERLSMMIREGRQVDAMGWAQAMGKLGRTLMDRPEQSSVADELAVVRHYLKVEAMRWPDTHFEVTADRALTDADARIPSLSVLPFVQAAMRLGAGQAQSERLLIVHFQGGADGTECVISSNGPAWAARTTNADPDNAVRDLREAMERFKPSGTCAITDMPEAGGTRILLRFRN